MPAIQTAAPPVRIDVYDGPLDLLLHLVRRDGIDVCNLPLVHITRQYLATLDAMAVLDLDIAGEFLVMAATLCELKSRELLPGLRHDEDPEADEEVSREDLIRRLILYQRYRQAAEGLRRRLWLGRDSFRRQAHLVEEGARPLESGTDALGLLFLYADLKSRAEQEEPVHEVEREPLSWSDTVHGVLVSLDDGHEHPLDELLAEVPSRAGRVLTFLAVLELCRVRCLDVEQRQHLAPILLRGLVSSEQADLSHIPEDM